MSAHLKNLRQIDPVLTQLAIGYKQNEFIAETVMPVVGVDKEGNRVPVFGKGSFVSYETERAAGAESNIVTVDAASMMDVVLAEHDLAVPVDYREKAESMFDMRVKATYKATNGIKLHQEIQTAELVQNDSVYHNNLKENLSLSPDKQWNNAKSDPLEAIFSAKEKVRRECGQEPNILVLGASVFNKLKINENLKSYLSGTEHKLLNKDILKNLFELDDIIVGKAVSTVQPNNPVEDIWKNFAALLIRPQIRTTGNDEGEPSFGYTFRLRGMPRVDHYLGNGGKIEYSRYTDIRKPAAVGGSCGYLFKNVIPNQGN